MTGKHHSEKTKEKLKQKGFERKQTKITKEKIREAGTGENNPNWKGGKFKSLKGYYYIWKPGHPFTIWNNYVLRSRLVAEKCLSRYLTPIEVIHHLNEIKDDDRPENLYLFETTGKHSSYHGLKNKPKLVSNLI